MRICRAGVLHGPPVRQDLSTCPDRPPLRPDRRGLDDSRETRWTQLALGVNFVPHHLIFTISQWCMSSGRYAVCEPLAEPMRLGSSFHVALTRPPQTVSERRPFFFDITTRNPEITHRVRRDFLGDVSKAAFYLILAVEQNRHRHRPGRSPLRCSGRDLPALGTESVIIGNLESEGQGTRITDLPLRCQADARRT
ncbi:hypothetical protein LX36DRAFT_20178 [Colletotrichum falcatum]|nr:hypothetical protein LX36DRAFT_20178 [Colletotrichum falcatum]